ncbi:hypothetical protein FHS05_002260 [Microbacterium endophyticum]|nr:hypothetical protein [Microbacterium endophyticum]NIK37221.1 hypothetical protein [Microbacterium endophyticum]
MRTTSTQRTYRYVRLSIVGAVFALGVTLAAVFVTDGPLTSISAAYYSPARDVFVGAIFAITLALVALSGRSIEQALLDYMAILAPIVAIVPTPIDPAVWGGTCADAPSCVPPEFAASVDVSAVALIATAAAAVGGAWALAIVQRTLSRASGIALIIAALIVIAMGAWWIIWPQGFLQGAHAVAASLFFGLIAAVATIAALGAGRLARTRRRGLIYRGAYATVAIGIGVSVALLITVVLCDVWGFDVSRATGIPLIFVGEALALALFAVFWTVQTVQLWNDPDASEDSAAEDSAAEDSAAAENPSAVPNASQ